MTARPEQPLDDPPLRENPLEAKAYREIVLRYGTKVTLEQVMDTLVEMGWNPPDPVRRPRPPKVILEVEDCKSCKASVNPENASALCRMPTELCPYKAARYGL